MEEELRRCGFKKSKYSKNEDHTNHWYKVTTHGIIAICDPDFKNYPKGLSHPCVVTYFDGTRKRTGEPTFWAELNYFLASFRRRML